MGTTKGFSSPRAGAGPAGPQGPKGDPGSTGATGATGATGSTGPAGPTGATGAQGPQGIQGPAGSNATATPLSTTTPAADTASGTVGTATSAARGDHAHPLPTGRLVLVGNVTVSKTLLIALSSGMTREDFNLSGITTADQGKLVLSPITPCSAGCEAINVYAKAANTVTLAYNTPALAIGAVINLPIAVYRIV